MSLERESDGLGCLDFIPSPLLSEISLLDACNRLCSRIITQFGSRELSSSKGRNDMPFGYGTHQPNLLGEYFQQGVGTFWLNAQTAMPPVHISAIGPSVVPHDDRFGGGANLFPVHFPYNEEAGGGVLGSAFDPHHPMLSSGVAVPGWNAHALEHLDRNRQMNLQRENTLTDTSLGRAKKRKELPVCMIYSCTSISEPCKRKLKLCSEHKRAAQVQLEKDGPLQRYCRYCHVLHDLDAFPRDDVRTICVRRNELRLKRSRERRKEMKMAADAARGNV